VLPAGVQAQLTANLLMFNNLRLEFPASGRLVLRLSGVRGDATFGRAVLPLPASSAPDTIFASLSFSPANLVSFGTTSTLEVGRAQRGLLATTVTKLLACHIGSPLPEVLNFQNLFNTTFYVPTRFSEAFASAFDGSRPDQTGTRLMMRITGLPSGTRLFAPALSAGSSALEPTTTSEFSGSANLGKYVAGSNTLLIALVQGTAQDGSGGSVHSEALGLSGTVTPTAVGEIPVNNGAATVVYQILSSDSGRIESVQVPVFVGLEPTEQFLLAEPRVRVSFAPIGFSGDPRINAPVPRFVDYAVPVDCTRDCDLVLPELDAPVINTEFTLTSGRVATRDISIENKGVGPLIWSARVEYQDGQGWIYLNQTSGVQGANITMTVSAPPQMPAGTYQATVVINAGVAGVARYPITLRILPGAPAPAVPVIQSLTNGASFAAGATVPGSIATIKGENLNAPGVQVTFNGNAAELLYTSSGQINLIVPPALSAGVADVRVRTGTTASGVYRVEVSPVNPGIFQPGILNADGTVHAANNPARAGSTVAIFATGLLAPDGTGAVGLKLNNDAYLDLAYAGPAPGSPAAQQVNFAIPAATTTGSYDLSVCGTVAGRHACSPPVKLHVAAQ
jgi:uncharacterized protein (TIGR03437 family)